jgi:putative acetyltransferase
MHALDLESLRQPDITFWTMWDAGVLAGCGALKALDPQHAEITSMRTAASHRRKGVAKRLLQHLLEEAKQRGYTRVSLETGSRDFFGRHVPCMPVLGLHRVHRLPTLVQIPIASL